MARKRRVSSVSDSTKRTGLSGKRVSRKNEIENSIKDNTFLDFHVKQKYEITPVHKSFLECCFKEECKMVMVDGPAGSAKTYLSVFVALQLLRAHKIREIVYIRSIVESAAKSMGSLPGEVDEKFLPWCFPLFEKLNEFLECDDNKDDTTDINVVLRDHKTSKKYGPQVVSMTRSRYLLIKKILLRYHPLKHISDTLAFCIESGSYESFRKIFTLDVSGTVYVCI